MQFMLSKTVLAALLAVSGVVVPCAASAQGVSAASSKAQAPLSLKVAVPSQAASALAIDLGSATKGRLLPCPSKLNLSAQALCLDAPQSAASVREAISIKLGSRALGDWKTVGKASRLLVKQGGSGFVVLLAHLSDKETLVIAQPAPSRALPTGVVAGELYLLGSDLAGLVKVTPLSGGQYRLERSGQQALTVTAGKTAAALGQGSVELPLAPATDGKNLLLPFSALRALGCTATPNGKVLTVACGSDSVGVKPIVF